MKIRKTLKLVVNIISWMWFLVHGAFSAHAFAFSQKTEDRVYVINSPLTYKLLNPISGGSLGFTLPFVGVAYVNGAAVKEADTSMAGVIEHEAKHIEQFWELGVQHFQIDEWKLEGVAEYARGGSTISLCASGLDESKARQRYRDYHVVVKYLIEADGLDENEIYRYQEYPLREATDWINTEICGKA
ncbi:hypothetical protein [uncultured Microbulbifer sp.]|uniref:hypothetical protein n=1 Tax=uncultured Microbulbifer sp. TaxID=348147 RepID=UPI00260F8E73|nr:hypothetical protein [uncultured Microbulbifer sp.]